MKAISPNPQGYRVPARAQEAGECEHGYVKPCDKCYNKVKDRDNGCDF